MESDKSIGNHCTVKLTKMDFSKIRMNCWAVSSEPGEDLICHLKQEGCNTFSLAVKRKEVEGQGSKPMDKLIGTEECKKIFIAILYFVN